MADSTKALRQVQKNRVVGNWELLPDGSVTIRVPLRAVVGEQHFDLGSVDSDLADPEIVDKREIEGELHYFLKPADGQ